MEYPGLEGTQRIIQVQFLSLHRAPQQPHPVLLGAVLFQELGFDGLLTIGRWIDDPGWEDAGYDPLTAGGQAVSSELASHGSPAVWALAAGSILRFDHIQLKSSTAF